jgi:hypothetical protein
MMGKKQHILFIALPIFFLLFFNITAQSVDAPQQLKSADNALQKALEEQIKIMNGANNNMSHMGAIYQAMYAMLKQTHDVKKDKLKEAVLSGQQKINASLAVIDAKKEEIKKKVEAARDEYISSCIMAVVQCMASITSVATFARQARASVQIPQRKFHLSYQQNVKNALNTSIKLQQDIQKLVKDKDKYPFTPKQKRQMNDLLKRLSKLKYSLDRSQKETYCYLQRLKDRRSKSVRKR